MARPKRPRASDDRLVGIRQRSKRDLFAGCNEPGKAVFLPNANEFVQTWCKVCKNADCIRARGAISPWETRMAEQVDYLLNDPVFSEIRSPEHQAFASMAFESLKAKAERLEIAARRQDWEIPDMPSDGIARLADRQTTSNFDDAARELARAKGIPEPSLPKVEESEAPTHFQPEEPPASEAPQEEFEYETQYPSSDGKNFYRVALTKAGKWSCACDGFRYTDNCKHLVTVRAWYEEQVALAEEEEQKKKEAASVPLLPSPPVAPTHDPRVPMQRPLNTPIPAGGVMVDTPAPMTPREVPDPWAPRREVVVAPGATIRPKKS